MDRAPGISVDRELELAERRMVERFLSVRDPELAERCMTEGFLRPDDLDRSEPPAPPVEAPVVAALAAAALASLAPPPAPRPAPRPVRITFTRSKPAPAPAAAPKRARKRPHEAAPPAPCEMMPVHEVPVHVQAEVRRLRLQETYSVLDVEDTPMHEMDARYECPLCMENALRVRLGPCGHCTCVACAKLAWGTTGRCLVCSAQIEGMLRVFVG